MILTIPGKPKVNPVMASINGRCSPHPNSPTDLALPEIDKLVNLKIREERRQDVKEVVEELDALNSKLDKVQSKCESLELKIKDVDTKIEVLHIQTGLQLDKLEKRMDDSIWTLKEQMERGFNAILLQLSELHNQRRESEK